jgi:hypothetical protein
MTLICKLVGHNYVFSAADMEEMCEVVCTRCGEKVKWPRLVMCAKGLHDWRPAGVAHFLSCTLKDGETRKTRRSWECPHCNAIKQDESRSMLIGSWFIHGGKFVSESEAIQRGYKLREHVS